MMYDGGKEDNRPNYYKSPDGKIEIIRVIQAFGLNFSLGNVLKYVVRAGRKNRGDALSDLIKARTYINLEIAYLQEKEEKETK